MMHSEDAVIERHELLTGKYRLLVLASPKVAAEVQPGQFVHVKLPAPNDALLRRPFSVFKAESGTLQILYKPVGRGTGAMTELRPGQRLNLIGPLGHGFPRPDPERFPVLVAGGYGMAALYLTARTSLRPGLAFFGGRGAEDILCVSDFEDLGWNVVPVTEDGSLGRMGRVTDALDEWLAEEEGEPVRPELFACGPNGLLRAVSERAEKRGIPAWISMDRNMGCGVGACLTCVCRVRDPEGDSTWARCCREGPVFNSRDILWEDPS